MPTFSDPRLAAILLGRRDVQRYTFPGTENLDQPIEIGIRILTDEEIDGARLEAARFVARQRANLQIDPEFFDRALVREVLSRACVDPDDEEPDPNKKRPFFADVDQVRALDAVVVAALHHHYLNHQDEVNPTISLSEDGIASLIERLGNGESSAAMLSSLDAPTLRSLVRILGRRLASSQTGR